MRRREPFLAEQGAKPTIDLGQRKPGIASSLQYQDRSAADEIPPISPSIDPYSIDPSAPRDPSSPGAGAGELYHGTCSSIGDTGSSSHRIEAPRVTRPLGDFISSTH